MSMNNNNNNNNSNNILSREELHANIEKTFNNIKKQIELIKNDFYIIKKSIKKHRKDIYDIRKETRHAKIRLKIVNNTHIIRKELNIIIKKAHTIRCNSYGAKNKTEIVKKELHTNKNSIRLLSDTVYDVNVSLCDTRKKFKKIIKVVLVIINESNK